MKVNSIHSSKQNFGSWQAGTKNVIKYTISELSGKKAQQEALDIVNRLHKTSQNHEISFDGIRLQALPHDNQIPFANLYYDGMIHNSPRLLVKSLKKLDAFITKDNETIPKVKDLSNGILPSIKEMQKDGITQSGVKILYDKYDIVASNIAKESIEKGDLSVAKKSVDLLKKIDEQAKQTQLHVFINPTTSEIKIASKYGDQLGHVIKEKQGKALVEADKYLQKVLKEEQIANLKEDKLWKKEQKQLQRLENWQNKKQQIKNFVQNSTVYKFVSKIADVVITHVDNIAKAKQLKKEQLAENIAKKLDID